MVGLSGKKNFFIGKDAVTLALGGTSAASSRCDDCVWQVLVVNVTDAWKRHVVQGTDRLYTSLRENLAARLRVYDVASGGVDTKLPSSPWYFFIRTATGRSVLCTKPRQILTFSAHASHQHDDCQCSD